MSADTPVPEPTGFSVGREEVSSTLSGPLAGIVNATFDFEETHYGGDWDRPVPIMLQYLRDADASSPVRVWPTAMANLEDPAEVADLLTNILTDSGGAGGTTVRERLLQAGVGAYLGCAMCSEAYLYPGDAEESCRRHGDRPLSEIAEALEIRTIRGLTAEGRRFVLVRLRGAEGAQVLIDPPWGVDPQHSNTAQDLALERLNEALLGAYGA